MARKFTEEQLSRILSHAHELEQQGVHRRFFQQQEDCQVGCINQAAYNEGDRIAAAEMNATVANKFDNGRRPKTADGVLHMLERIGCA